ncbi:hypothetical protein D3C78_1793170 [compost metagenome]
MNPQHSFEAMLTGRWFLAIAYLRIPRQSIHSNDPVFPDTTIVSLAPVLAIVANLYRAVSNPDQAWRVLLSSLQ